MPLPTTGVKTKTEWFFTTFKPDLGKQRDFNLLVSMKSRQNGRQNLFNGRKGT